MLYSFRILHRIAAKPLQEQSASRSLNQSITFGEQEQGHNYFIRQEARYRLTTGRLGSAGLHRRMPAGCCSATWGFNRL
jgi:hypothetical protein